MGGELGDGRSNSADPGKSPQVFFHKRDLGQCHSNLAHIAFRRAFPKVLFQGSIQLFFISHDVGAELSQGAEPAFDRQSSAAPEICPLLFQCSLNVFLSHPAAFLCQLCFFLSMTA